MHSGIHKKIMMLLLTMFLVTGDNSATPPMADCQGYGYLAIPYRFSRRSDWFLNNSFLITCNHNDDPSKPIPEFALAKLPNSSTHNKIMTIEKKSDSNAQPKSRISRSILFCIAFGLMVPAFCISWIFWRRMQRKATAVRQRLFQQNGGRLLENMLSRRRTLEIFTAEVLKKATDNYNERNLLWSGHSYKECYYKGVLPDGANCMVMIKTCQLYAYNVESFISKLVLLSQIKHRSVVNLLGCCLETTAPMVVYEFISKKTLYDYIHDEDPECFLSWDIRLKIAAETAGALACLLSSASTPIIHGNISSSSILLHHNSYAVKVHDFRLTTSHIPFLHFEWDSSGYVDPEYLHWGKLTVQTDVYSFGVVLAELLTGQEVGGLYAPEGNLVMKFVSANREDKLIRIMDSHLETDHNIEQIREVANLACKCLSVSSIDRPTMKDVAISLEDVLSMNSGSTCACQS